MALSCTTLRSRVASITDYFNVHDQIINDSVSLLTLAFTRIRRSRLQDASRVVYAGVSCSTIECELFKLTLQARQLRVHAVSDDLLLDLQQLDQLVEEAPLTFRNGDYAPTRFAAQAQAVSTVFTSKTESNPESSVGLMTMAGKTCVDILLAAGRS